MYRAKFLGDRSNFCEDMPIFPFFQYGSFPPSWICDARVWTTHEGHLVVFITVQNLVGIDLVLSINACFWFCEFGFRPPKLGFWGTATKPVHRLQIRPKVQTIRGSPYHSPKLYPGPCSSVDVRPGTDTQRQTVRQTHRRGWPQYISRRYDSREM